MTIYKLAGGALIKDPQYIQALSIEIVNLADRDFDVLVQGFQGETKIAEVLNHIERRSLSPKNKVRLPIIVTDGFPFSLLIITNRNTVEHTYFFIHALNNDQIVGVMTNEHMTIEAEGS